MNPAPATVIDVMVMVRSLPIPPVEDSGIGQRGFGFQASGPVSRG